MPLHLYILPAIGTGVRGDPRRPKYLGDFVGDQSALDFGFQPVFLVVKDISDADHALLSANGDVFAFPEDLASRPLAAAVPVIQAQLELVQIPADWVNAASQWRDIARTIAGMFLFFQRLNAVWGNVQFLDGTTRTLNTRFNQLDQAQRQALEETSASLGYTVSFSPNDTLRNILKAMADAWGTKPIFLGGITL